MLRPWAARGVIVKGWGVWRLWGEEPPPPPRRVANTF